MHFTLATLLTIAAGLAGYFVARRLVNRRLRFVDAVRSRWAPLVAGAAAALLAAPLALLPLISPTTAVVFGLGTGLGTASAGRALRRGEATQRQLLP